MKSFRKGKGMLLILLLLCMLAGCGKVKTVTEEAVGSKSSEEAMEDNTMDEAQKLRNEGDFDSAEQQYQNAYDSTGNENALIAVIDMWISEANDEKVKKWVDYAKTNCEAPSAELSAIMDRGEKLKWMIRNIEAQNQDDWKPFTDNFYVDYDESGRIIRTNIAFHDGTLRPCIYGADDYFTYEYKEDGSLKVTEYGRSETPYIYEYTYDEEGRILIFQYFDFREGQHVPTNADYYQYGLSYEDHAITGGAVIHASAEYGEVPSDSEYRESSIKYSGDKIDMFGLKSEYDGNDKQLYYTKDDYGNIVQCIAYFESFWNSGLDYQWGIEYVYCTPAEYLQAKGDDDFSQYKISSFNVDDVDGDIDIEEAAE